MATPTTTTRLTPEQVCDQDAVVAVVAPVVPPPAELGPTASNATATYANEMVILDVAKLIVSPAPTVLFADRLPHQRRIGLPALSHSSMPTTVHAGMPVKVRAPALLVIEPLAAAPQMVTVVVSCGV